MTREEWTAWGNSLKSGDKVIVKYVIDIRIDTVKKITPAGWIVTENSGTYSQSRWSYGYEKRGGYGNIIPITKELEEQALQEMEKKEKRKKIERTISAAKGVAYDWCYRRREMNYALACKILELVGEEVK